MRYATKKKQGDYGLGEAIAWFTKQGLTVSIPLTDSQDYDLIVDSLDGIERVQVKTTTQCRFNNPIVQLAVKGGNKSGTGNTKLFNKSKVDSIFVVCEKSNYWIPSQVVETRYQITLGETYEPYRL